MSDEPLKKFTDLSNFQQWCLFYLQRDKKIRIRVQEEINNFCDSTKDRIDLDHFDEEMSLLQNEMHYFEKNGIVEDTGSDYYILTNKGQLYCFQNLEKNLNKLSLSNVLSRIKASTHYTKNQQLCEKIFSARRNLQEVAKVLIDNKTEAMVNIKTFVEILKILQGIIS